MGDARPVRRRVKIKDTIPEHVDDDRLEEVEESGQATGGDQTHQKDRVGYAGATTDGETDIDGHDDNGHRVHRRRSRRELERVHFQMVNDRVVEDITLDVLYKPHTLTMLAILCAVLGYIAFNGAGGSTERNVYDGLMGTLTLFLVVSALAFPNGPFIRPHPILWRIIFGLSVVYLMLLQFTLFQTHGDVKKVLTWLDPKGLSKESLVEKQYAVNCSDLTWQRFWSHCDYFAVGHFTGWVMKALLIRHGVICWYISIAWEMTEVVFTHLLPNFEECWWDAIILDILLCNGIGIWCGLKICEFLEMRQFHWESIKDIKTHRAKFKRAVMQFTPESWTHVNWFNSPAIKRTMALYVFVLIWLQTELNTFFLKHVFAVETEHPVVFWRLILIALISAPSIRQYYLYATDPLVTRLGMQCWVYCAVCALEGAICLKFGRDMFPQFDIWPLVVWILVLIGGTFCSVWVSVWWAHKSEETKTMSIDGEKRCYYLDSSHENLGAIHDDVRRRRRSLGFSESDYN